MHIITASVGDFGGDGHSQSRVFTFVSNFTSDQIWACYQAGSKSLGFDLVAEYCEDYEQDTLPHAVIEKLEAKGIVVKHWNYNLDTDEVPFEPITEETGITPELWFELFMKIAKLGSIGVPLEYILHERTPMNIGGYGLFQ